MNQHSRMPVLVLTCPDRQVILYNYPKCCFFKPKLQLFSLTPSIWVPQNNDRTRTEWQRPSVVPAPSCWRHETDACTWILSQLGCMSQKWNSGLMGTECIASQRNQLMVPALAEPLLTSPEAVRRGLDLPSRPRWEAPWGCLTLAAGNLLCLV